jgi:hypothetical protein
MFLPSFVHLFQQEKFEDHLLFTLLDTLLNFV